MYYHEHHHQEFKARVSKALKSVRRVLDVERSEKLQMPDDVDHEYQDKFKLTDLMTNMGIVSFVTILKELGLTKEILRTIDTSKETTLRFSTTETCTFVNEEIVDELSPFSKVTEETTTQVEKSDSSLTPEEEETATKFRKMLKIGMPDKAVIQKMSAEGVPQNIQNSVVPGGPATKKSTIETIVKRVLKQNYMIEKDWELSVYSGTDVENRTILQERKGAFCNYVRELSPNQKGKSKSLPPFPPKTVYPHIELSLTWLLQQIDAVELKSHFAIDTTPGNKDTKTPLHNAQMQEVISFTKSAHQWAFRVEGSFNDVYTQFKPNGLCRTPTLQCAGQANAIFVPIIPLMVNRTAKGVEKGEEDEWEETAPSSMDTESESKTMVALPPAENPKDTEEVILSKSDTTSFLNEHCRTLSEALSAVEEDFVDLGATSDLISSRELKMQVLFIHMKHLLDQVSQSVRYIDGMLKLQLVAAIGKEVGKGDIDNFMRYHNEKLFNPRPERFCYTIRRPEHYPDGILSIEETTFQDSKEEIEPISTHVRNVSSTEPIQVPLNAATTISLTGKTNLHGWLNHRFGDRASDTTVRLNARARQFSSFVLLVGTMTNQNQLQPKDAIILRNKDEVHIPLLLNEIPTSKEFKDAIGSLSPEQQRFAKSFRSMQLESSVLGVCVVQIKPQLERLLGLPKDSLQKEMKLTEDLTELFIEYQVPSDLVSCDLIGDYDASYAVAKVREHVESVMGVIAAQKKEELEEQKRIAEMAKAKERERRFEEEEGCEECAEEPDFEYFSADFAGNPRPVPQAAFMLGCSNPPPKPKVASRSGLFGPEAEVYSRPDGKKVRRIKRSSLPLPVGRALQAPVANSLAAATCEASEFDEAPSSDRNRQKASSRKKSSVSNTPSIAGTQVAKNTQGNVTFASMPEVLNKAIELHDEDVALRSTTIKTGIRWARFRQKNLLSSPKRERLSKSEIASEKARAFDLLDALSRSGSLDIPFSELHVMICATHSFEKNVMDTVIRDNVNPIEKLEVSTLLMASTILGVPPRDLIRDGEDRERLENSFPLLLCNDSEEQDTDVIDADVIGN